MNVVQWDIVIKNIYEKLFNNMEKYKCSISEKKRKLYTQYDHIITKRQMCNLYVCTGILKCCQHINSVSLLVVGFEWYLLFSLYLLHCLN